jgi:hypothetical protein
MHDVDDVKALLAMDDVFMTYKDDHEKATIKAALEKVLPRYLEKTRWSAEKWKTKLGLA